MRSRFGGVVLRCKRCAKSCGRRGGSCHAGSSSGIFSRLVALSPFYFFTSNCWHNACGVVQSLQTDMAYSFVTMHCVRTCMGGARIEAREKQERHAIISLVAGIHWNNSDNDVRVRAEPKYATELPSQTRVNDMRHTQHKHPRDTVHAQNVKRRLEKN